MSRITPPVTKLNHAVRSLSSSATRLRDPSRHALPLKPELAGDSHRQSRRVTSSKNETDSSTSTRPFHTHTLPPHRPSTTTTPRTMPLMQGFRTTSAAPAPAPTSTTMDFITLPAPPSAPSANPYTIRVPLLPDNYFPDRTLHAAEVLDGAVAGAQIHVVDEQADVVAALSEVVGNEAVEREWATAGRREEEKGEGVLRELWSGIVEDVFGERKVKLAV